MRDETITFYHAAPSRGSIVLWMLEEVGAPYRLELLDLNKGQQKEPAYLAVNPMGKVPAIVHRRVAITEVAAICCYLAESFPDAGLAPPMSDLQDSEWDDLKTVLDTNVTGLVALTRACLPKLIAAKGLVVNLSSVAGTYPYRGGAVYGATKAFVRQFSLMLRNDLAGTGVRVTSIEPGMAETEFTLVRNGGDKAASDALYSGIEPMTAEDLANTLRDLADRTTLLHMARAARVLARPDAAERVASIVMEVAR